MTSSAQQNPLAGQEAAIQAGENRFKGSCAACHGGNAEGGRGPNLVENRDLQGMPDRQLFDTIQHGISGTSMPPSHMSDQQTWQVVAFVRSLGTPAYQSVLPGNSPAGRSLFYGQARCGSCHAIRGEGGKIGPDLSNVGADLTLPKLKESILQPSAGITPGFDAVRAHLKNGTTIEGIAKNNSTYSIQIQDAQGALHLLNKTEVERLEWSRRSLMPDHLTQELGSNNLNDIIAFLAAQTVRPPSDIAQPQHRREIH